MKFMSWVSSVCWDETLHLQEQPGGGCEGASLQRSKARQLPGRCRGSAALPKPEVLELG